MSIASGEQISENARVLGAFLRAHRERITPDAVGLPTTTRRRTPGLRREEIATLAGVGLAWYTWLERGRVTASRQVLESIGRALHLHESAHSYMLAVGGYATLPGAPQPHLSAAHTFIVDDWQHGPAFLIDSWFTLRAWNDSFAAVWGDPEASDEVDRNLIVMLADPDRADAVLGSDRQQVLRRHLGIFRKQTALHDRNPRLAPVYERLNSLAPNLADWWTCQGMDPLQDHEQSLHVGRESVRVWQTALRADDDALIVLQRARTAADRTIISAAARAADTNRSPLRATLAIAS
ncbi:helix-turn-helix domain-containing protein [Microbacterium saperdae]